MSRWPHQIQGVRDTLAAIDAGELAICLTSPTGGGKSLMIRDLLVEASSRDWRSIIYSNRIMLTEQLAAGLDAAGIAFGIRAAGHVPDFTRKVQISQIQTEDSRVYRRKDWDLYPAKLVLVDEAHNQKAGVFHRVIQHHLDAGAAVVGITATPLDIGHIYKRLVVAGRTSDLWQCGALVPAYVYAPDEPDTRDLKRTKTGEFVEGEVVKAIMSPTIFARVVDNYCRLNPDRRPSILFAPGVGESVWFAEQFKAAGIKAAHIDGESIWIDGERHATSPALRQEVMDLSKSGAIEIICNRFVLREAIDMPWLFHGILATIFGSLTGYLQSVGRLLRAHPSLNYVQIQDHGGNFWRHGSPNADREWNLSQTAKEIAETREQGMREKREPDPIVCPKCHAVRAAGNECQKCHFVSARGARMVVQKNGSLVARNGDILKPRKVAQKPDTVRLWEQCYHRCKRKNKTFKQARGLFFMENHYWPPDSLPLMPKHPDDWKRGVADVEYRDLIPKEMKH